MSSNAAQSIRNTLQLAGQRFVSTGQSIWNKGWGERGRQAEAAIMRTINGWFGAGNNVATIDGYDDAAIKGYEGVTGTAYSVKSLDLAGKSYQTAQGITATLKSAVQKLSDFGGFVDVTNANGEVVQVGQVTMRVLHVAIPKMDLSAEQAAALKAVQDWAAGLSNWVRVVYTVVE